MGVLSLHASHRGRRQNSGGCRSVAPIRAIDNARRDSIRTYAIYIFVATRGHMFGLGPCDPRPARARAFFAGAPRPLEESGMSSAQLRFPQKPLTSKLIMGLFNRGDKAVKPPTYSTDGVRAIDGTCAGPCRTLMRSLTAHSQSHPHPQLRTRAPRTSGSRAIPRSSA